jgi:hypothetical protein
MQIRKKIVYWGLIILTSSVSDAAQNKRLKFEAEAVQFTSFCSDEKCVKPFEKKLIYNFVSSIKIDVAFEKILFNIAKKQAQIWGDTILEGDFAAAGSTRLDRAYALFKNKQLFGYLITYSEKAWNTSNCSYDGINDATLSGCTEGRISESVYVSADYTDYFIDDKMFAEFK